MGDWLLHRRQTGVAQVIRIPADPYRGRVRHERRHRDRADCRGLPLRVLGGLRVRRLGRHLLHRAAYQHDLKSLVHHAAMERWRRRGALLRALRASVGRAATSQTPSSAFRGITKRADCGDGEHGMPDCGRRPRRTRQAHRAGIRRRLHAIYVLDAH